MTTEYVPLETLLENVNRSLEMTAERVDQPDRQTGETHFTVGECTFALSVELQSEGDRVLARFPSALEGERVQPEYLSRLTVSLRRAINFDRPV